MGREVESLAVESGFEVVSISYKNVSDKLDRDGIGRADVAIDFTAPQVVVGNISQILPLGVNMVVGTTGWYDDLARVRTLVSKNKAGLVYAKNFSVGANIFFKIVAGASKLFDRYGGYDVYGLEIHHSGKKDSPSGTAKKIADTVIANFAAKKKANFDKLDRQVTADELHFASLRGGNNPGFHEVIFDSIADEIRLSHAAHGRRGFASGALLAAKFIKNKKGLFAFEELFEKGKI